MQYLVIILVILLSLLLVATVLTFLVGMIRPSVFARFLKQNATRVHISAICSASFIVSLISIVICTIVIGLDDNVRGRSEGGTTPTDDSKKARIEAAPADHEIGLSSSDREDSVWFSGGSLHGKSALDWQVASNANKMATCGDFLATMWMAEDFTPIIQSSITSMASLKPLAQELIVCIDEATRPEPDSVLNRQMYTNQKVASMATFCIVAMGWLR